MIRMNDMTSEPGELQRQELAAVERVFRSGSFILGSEVRQFEEASAYFYSTVGSANCKLAHPFHHRRAETGI
jgi:dTDP-4-amino-4,6-dideoxygalactose transaminase